MPKARPQSHRRLLLGTSALALTGATLIACSSCSRTPELVSDAGEDGGEHDGAVRDAAHADAGDQPASDGGPIPDFDAAAFDPFAGEWDLLPNRPTGCPVRYAATPKTSVPALAWAACTSGRAGCRKLIVDWPRTTGRSIAFPETEPVKLINGSPYLEYIKFWPSGAPSLREFEAYMYAITKVDGDAAFGIGDVKEAVGCAAEIGFGDYGIGVDAFMDGKNEMFGWAPWSNPTALTSVSTSLPTGTTATDLSLSKSQVFASLQPPGVAFLHVADGGLVDHNTPSAFPGFQTLPTDDGAFSTDSANANLLRNDGSWSAVITPSSGNVVTWLMLDRSASNAFVWIEAVNSAGSYTTPTIWTSPYATSAANVVRRKVAVVTDTNQLGLIGSVSNAGMTLMVTSPTKALLTRLSDGAGWTIAPEAGDAFAWPLWVDDNEVWIASGPASDPSYSADLNGVTRVTRASLGTPTVGRGF